MAIFFGLAASSCSSFKILQRAQTMADHHVLTEFQGCVDNCPSPKDGWTTSTGFSESKSGPRWHAYCCYNEAKTLEEILEGAGPIGPAIDIVSRGSDGSVQGLYGATSEHQALIAKDNARLSAAQAKVRITSRESLITGCSLLAGRSFENASDEYMQFVTARAGGNVLFIASENRQTVETESTTYLPPASTGPFYAGVPTATTDVRTEEHHTVRAEIYKCPE
jgi:hypothetical protein